MSDQTVTTLSDRLTQGPLPAPEAQRYAAALAEVLRRLHDQGTVVGVLRPSRIILSGVGVEIVMGGEVAGVTSYTAPEQLQGAPADARSDIFAFGAIVQEMLSGRRVFQGGASDELKKAILEQEPAALPAEHAEFARVVTKCLAKAPLQRWQRMQRVQMELKLLTVFARRAEQEAATKTDRVQALVRAGIGDLETRLAARFAAQDSAASQLRARIEAQEDKLRAAAETELALRAEIAMLETRLGTRMDACDRKDAGLEQKSADHEVRMAASGETAAALATRLTLLEQAVKAHSSGIESLESAIAQTDDLVERVVEAFDSLEKSQAEQNELRMAAGRN